MESAQQIERRPFDGFVLHPYEDRAARAALRAYAFVTDDAGLRESILNDLGAMEYNPDEENN